MRRAFQDWMTNANVMWERINTSGFRRVEAELVSSTLLASYSVYRACVCVTSASPFSILPPCPSLLPFTLSPRYGVQVAFSCRPLHPGKIRLRFNATAIEDTHFNVWRRAMDPTPYTLHPKPKTRCTGQ